MAKMDKSKSLITSMMNVGIDGIIALVFGIFKESDDFGTS